MKWTYRIDDAEDTEINVLKGKLLTDGLLSLSRQKIKATGTVYVPVATTDKTQLHNWANRFSREENDLL
jgi:hypothetical protein